MQLQLYEFRLTLRTYHYNESWRGTRTTEALRTQRLAIPTPISVRSVALW